MPSGDGPLGRDPRGGARRASTVVWELRCPLRGYIVAGVDARVSDRAIDVSIRGENGAPVSPGVTTGAAVVFTAVYTGGAARPTSFQPFIGCIPTSGGGARGETALRRPAAYVPAAAIDRRVFRTRLVSGASVKVVAGAPPGRVCSARATRMRFAPGPSRARRSSTRCVCAAPLPGGR